MKKKNYLALLLAAALCLGLFGCGGAQAQESSAPAEASVQETTAPVETPEEPEPSAEPSPVEETPSEPQEIAIGTTGFTITIPGDYKPGEVTEEEKQDDMIAYYYSDSRLMDFDIYQFPTEGMKLDEYAAKEAREYHSTGFEMVDIQNRFVALYYSGEEYAGEAYQVANYIFEAGEDFGEISFWLDGPEAEELVEEIIQTLTGPEPVEEPSVKPSPAAEASSFVGSWKFYSQEGSGNTMTHEEILEMPEQIMTFREDGTVIFSISGIALAEYTWTDNGDGTGAVTLAAGPEPIYLEDGYLVQDRGLFLAYYESVEEPELQSLPTPAEASSFVGSWMLYAQEGGGADIPHDIIAAMGWGEEQVITLNPDGTLQFYLDGELLDDKWTDNGDGTGTITLMGETYDMEIRDGLLVIHMADYDGLFESTDVSAAERMQ